MPIIDVKLVNLSNNEPPAYETSGAAGMDLRAHLSEQVLLQPMDRMLVPTGLYLQIPFGFEAQVRPRSGLALKHGITCLNTPGTIDSDYRGEIKVMLINLGKEAFAINPGDRIAQMVVQSVAQVQWQAVAILDETHRGAGGFGHTGR